MAVSACGGGGDSGADTGDTAVVPAALAKLQNIQMGLPGAPNDTVTLVDGREESTLNGKPWVAQLQDIHVAGALGGEEPGSAGIMHVQPGDGTTQVYLVATDVAGAVRRAALFPLGLDVDIERMGIVERQIGVTFSDGPSVPAAKRKSHFRLVSFGTQVVDPPLLLVSKSDSAYASAARTKTATAWGDLSPTPVKNNGSVLYKQTVVYSFAGALGSSANVTVESADNDVYISVIGPDGTSIVPSDAKARSWSGNVVKGTYKVQVFTTNGGGAGYRITANS